MIGTDRFQVAPLRSAGALFRSVAGTDSPLSPARFRHRPPDQNPVSRPCLTTRRTSDACPVPLTATLEVKRSSALGVRGEQREANSHAARSTSSLRAADECTFTRTIRPKEEIATDWGRDV